MRNPQLCVQISGTGTMTLPNCNNLQYYFPNDLFPIVLAGGAGDAGDSGRAGDAGRAGGAGGLGEKFSGVTRVFKFPLNYNGNKIVELKEQIGLTATRAKEVDSEGNPIYEFVVNLKNSGATMKFKAALGEKSRYKSEPLQYADFTKIKEIDQEVYLTIQDLKVTLLRK